MNKTFIYDVNIDNFNIVKTKEEQFDKFFYSGHPKFMISDFNEEPSDIWLSFLEFIEKEIGGEVYDQDGGEVSDEKLIDDTGLTECIYHAEGIQLTEDSDYVDYLIKIEGYVVEQKPNEDGYIDHYFLAKKVIIKEKV